MMPEIINHFFAGETTITPAPNGPIRMTSHNFFGGVSFNDREISPLTITHSLSFSTDVPSVIGVMATGNHTITVEAAGTGAIDYAWYINGVATDKTDDYLTISNPSASNDGDEYYVVATDEYGDSVKSNVGTVKVYDVLKISTDLSNVSISVGDSTTLTATFVGGVPPLSYSWTKNGGALSEASNILSINSATANESGDVYAVKATDFEGNASSSANATLTVVAGISITVDLASSVTATAGSTANIGTVSVTGGVTPYKYQWYKNGNAISGATGASLTTGTLSTTDSGAIYHVTITDANGDKVTSADCTLTVNAAS